MKQKNKLLIGAAGFLVVEGMTLIPHGKHPEDHSGELMISIVQASPMTPSFGTSVAFVASASGSVVNEIPGFPLSRE
jgi:hypothetical protein